MRKVSFRKADVDGFNIFYREAGPTDAQTLLLLHGFPSASHMFRDLVPGLADRFHVIAPDLPGFGQSDMPDRSAFTYTFHNIARVIDRFTELVGLDRFAIYVFDYGAPTGFRLAMWHPERVAAIISQNGNAYAEGLSDGVVAWCARPRLLLAGGRVHRCPYPSLVDCPAHPLRRASSSRGARGGQRAYTMLGRTAFSVAPMAYGARSRAASFRRHQPARYRRHGPQ